MGIVYIGDICKWSMGGVKYGLDMWFVLILLCILFKIIFLWLEVEIFFLRKLECMVLNIGILIYGWNYFVKYLLRYWF